MHTSSLLEIGAIGFLAQIIDGTSGMGYSVSSSALLICLGIPPKITSVSVHTSEVVTTLVSGVSHFKFGNVRKDLLLPLISFGVISLLHHSLHLVAKNHPSAYRASLRE